jgi:glycosyltransferase involved in cell wall biosynthesis
VQDLAREFDHLGSHAIISTRSADSYSKDIADVVSAEIADAWLRDSLPIFHLTFSRRRSFFLLREAVRRNQPFWAVIHCETAHLRYGNLAGTGEESAYFRELMEMLSSARKIVTLSAGAQKTLSEQLSRSVDCYPLMTLFDDVMPEYKPEDKTIIWAGEVSEIKGADRLLQLTKAGSAQFVFRIYGGGLTGTTRSIEVTNAAVLGTVPRQQVLAAMNRSQLCVNTSRSEGWCRVSAEALLIGCPIASVERLGVMQWLPPEAYFSLPDPLAQDAAEVRDSLRKARQWAIGRSPLDTRPLMAKLNDLARASWRDFFLELSSCG